MTRGAIERLQPAPPVLLRLTGSPLRTGFVCVPAVASAPKADLGFTALRNLQNAGYERYLAVDCR
jgi:hypothetical protein